MNLEKNKALPFVLAGALAVSFAPASVDAAVLFADLVAAGTGSCNSLINAGTLADCINVAVAGDNIVVMPGTHVASGLTIPVSVTINGGGMGVSTIDAQSTGRHFIVDPGAGGSVVIKDVTLTGGNALAVGQFEDGGAVQAVTGVLELVRTEILNSSAFEGGAISCDGCDELNVRESRLSGNTATTDGGAIISDADITLVANSTIQGNTAGDDGGGIYKVNDSITIRDSEIVENAANGGDGGGLYSSHDDSKILRSAFIGNTATGNGGAVSVHGANVVDELLVLNSTFSANAASSGGALDIGVNNPAWIGNATLVDNLATTAGQADDIESSSALVTINLTNSIVTHPAIGGVNPECGNAGAAVTLNGTGNLIDTAASCLGNGAGFRIAAITAGTLGSLDFHGGPTRVYSLVNVAGNNAIDNPAVGLCLNPRSLDVLDRDQRSRPRPTVAGGLGDIGAFEKQ
jgi:predicted outer membrane repeat protein